MPSSGIKRALRVERRLAVRGVVDDSMLLKITEKIARRFNALFGFPNPHIKCSRLTIVCIGFCDYFFTP